jgi:catechol 2,3-dioxygenase-like lactoylglutathione lyase family enzyme
VRLTHVRLLVSDMSASYRLYRDLLGLPSLRDPDGNLIALYHDIEWARGA